MKIMAIVPAYNEEKNIYKVVSSIKKYRPDVDVLVVNDGSTDDTSYEARRAGARVIDITCNLGIGGAVQTGYIYAIDNGYDIVIQIDGDGQHDAKDLSRLINCIETGEADMAIGSRFIDSTGYKPTLLRKIGIEFFSIIASLLIGCPIKDTTSGYRAVNRKVIELFANYYPLDYPEVEALVYASRRGVKIKEISVDMKERAEGRSSITPFKAFYYMIKVTLALIIQP